VEGKREELTAPTGTADEHEAERQALEWQADLNGVAVGADPTVLAVLDARIRELEQAPGTNPGTIATYRTARAGIAETALAGVRESELNRGHVREAQRALRAGGRNGVRAPRTVNTWLGLAKAAWNQALEDERVKRPWPKVDPLGVSEPQKRAYLVEEVDAVLADLREQDPDWYPVFALVAATGCRIGEILFRRARDVMSGVLVVRWSKTGQPRDVGVPKAVLDLLPGRVPDALLFPSPTDPSKPLGNGAALRALRRSLARLKIPDADWLDVHSFRRAWCADSEEAGVPRHQAMAQSGHASGRVFDAYAGKARARRRQTAEQVQAHRRAALGGRDPGAPEEQEEDDDHGPDGPAGVTPSVTPSGGTDERKPSQFKIGATGPRIGILLGRARPAAPGIGGRSRRAHYCCSQRGSTQVHPLTWPSSSTRRQWPGIHSQPARSWAQPPASQNQRSGSFQAQWPSCQKTSPGGFFGRVSSRAGGGASGTIAASAAQPQSHRARTRPRRLTGRPARRGTGRPGSAGRSRRARSPGPFAASRAPASRRRGAGRWRPWPCRP
jgi:integrase